MGYADRAELERDLRRVADRLRTAPLTRLTSKPAVGPSPAEQTRPADQSLALLHALADLTAGTVARESVTPPEWRAVPHAGASALGDQVTVLGLELTTAIGGVGDETMIWTPTGRRQLGEVLDELAGQLRDLRRSL